MQTFSDLKERETTACPLLIFDCTFSDGTKHFWSTQAATVNGNAYVPRICRNNVFEIQTTLVQNSFLG